MTRRSKLVAAGLVGLLAAFPAWTSQAAPADPADKKPGKARILKTAEAIPGQWIVVLREDATDKDRRNLLAVARSGGASGLSEYDVTLNGFAGRMSDKVVQRIRGHRAVEFIEADQPIEAAATQNTTAPWWGLDRLDQRNLPLSGTYTYNRTGAGVRAYIVDSGVRASHEEFTGRVLPGIDTLDNDTDPADCNGHGTHVAGTVAGTTSGVAKGASIVPVRVLDCVGEGTGQAFLDGVEWTAVNHPVGTPGVANASLTFRAHFVSVERAIEKSIARGISWVIAAGNDNVDACDQSAGSRVDRSIVVGATGGASGQSDAKASFSNWGSCIDIFAPGVRIGSAGHGADDSYVYMSGTSMAAPHVAGAVALYLQSNPTATPARVKGVFVNQSTKGVVTGLDAASPNRLLYTGFIN